MTVGHAVYGLYVWGTVWLLFQAAIQLHLFWHAQRHRRPKDTALPLLFPFVTVQLPVYNEKYLIEGAMKCLAGLDYPKHRFEIQVLDDSTDETSPLIDLAAARLASSGINVSVLRRQNRDGFKAGALQYGLLRSKGDFLAVFDTDFRPPANFVTSLLPHFQDKRIGMAQARWGHLNAEQNFLTRIQAYLLDMHFGVEQNGRHNAGYFLNFCGTAGIWRKQCVSDAGGWDGSVLSEDLDLSYRAQLRGWKLIYDDEAVVPGQLPTEVEAFKVQQFRWTKGIAQTARRNLKSILSMPVPFVQKLHCVAQLTGSLTFVCLLLNAVLTVPMLHLRNAQPQFIALTNYTVIGALNLAALGYLYYKSSTRGSRFAVYYPLFVVVYLAMSVQNAIAVLQGWFGYTTPFVRTPKASADGTNGYLRKKGNWITAVEFGLLLYFLYGVGYSFYTGDRFFLLFFFMMIAGLCTLLYPLLPAVRLKANGSFRPFPR